MRPLTAKMPKVMLPVAGKPLLEHILIRARGAGVDRFVLVVGYEEQAVRSHFGDGSQLGVGIDYVLQDRQLGTGHALLAAQDQAEDRFLVLNGDVLPDEATLQEMARGGPAVSAIVVEDPGRYGVFLEEGGRFKSVVEKSEQSSLQPGQCRHLPFREKHL